MRMIVTRGIVLVSAAGLATAAIAAVPAKEFVMKAGAGDLYEEQSSKLVLASTGNAKIKSFATMMIADHRKTTAGVEAAVKADGMVPKPPMLAPEQADMIAKLKAATGPARDALYVEQQKTAHREALALMTDYAAGGDNLPLKKAATAAVPIVRHHIEMLAAL